MTALLSNDDVSQLLKATTWTHTNGGYPASGHGSSGQGANYGGPGPGSSVYLNSTGNVTPTYQTFTLAPSPAHPVMAWEGLQKGCMDIIFYEEENGVWVKAELAPAYDLTPREGLLINALIAGISAAAAAGKLPQDIKPLSFIRRGNLERHFNMSLA
jgi:hypothetical protein